MERITVEVVRRAGAKSVQVRGVLTSHDGTVRVSTPTYRHALSDSVASLTECELYEIVGQIEAEIRGWQAKLPLNYI